MSDEEKAGAIVRDELNRADGFDPTWDNVHNAALAGLRAGREQVADIMQRRTWFPRFIGSIEGKQRWVVYCWNGLCDLRDTTAVWMYANTKERAAHLVFEDPIQALIETEKWYVENVEKPHAAAIRGGGG